MRRPILLLLLSCCALASAKNVENHVKLVKGQRDVSQDFYNKQFSVPTSTSNFGLQPPPYLNSLVNEILDLKGGGHSNYLNIYPSSWTTSQVNSDLTVDVQFTAHYNGQNSRCSAHISASMPPESNLKPALVLAGSSVQCSPSTGQTHSAALVNPGPVYRYSGYGAPGYGPPAYKSAPPYFLRHAPQVVYRTKYVPITVPSWLPPPQVPSTLPVAPSFYGPTDLTGSVPSWLPPPQVPSTLPVAPSFYGPTDLTGSPVRIPTYTPLGYNGLPVHDVLPALPQYIY